MGMLDWLFGGKKVEGKEKESGKAEVPQAPESKRILAKPFIITTSFTPFRLAAKKSNSVALNVTIKNITPDPQLVSVDIMLPKAAFMGFEPSCINKVMEKRLGEIKPGETATASVQIWGGTQTAPGNYEVGYTVYAHYIGYEKVLNYQKNKTILRVV